jgi:aminoglycoside phosphotransferase
MDLAEMARRLSSCLGSNQDLAIDACERTFVSYKVGRRLRVVYRIQTGGKEHLIAASTFRSARRSERAYLKAMERAGGNGSLRPVGYDAPLNTVFWTFPNDRRIENLTAISTASSELTRSTDPRWTRSSLVDYYPEVSAVLRCLDGSDRIIAYAKVHAGDDGERTHGAQRALVAAARGSGLPLARPLAYSEQHRTLLVEPMVGRSVRRLRGRELPAGLYAYGAALATLHSLSVVEIPLASRSPLERLQRKAPDIALVRPDIAEPTGELISRLTERWDDAAGEPVLVHGDTNENNAILVGDRVGLIDFDRASIGSAGSDVGNFLGLLRYFRSLGLMSTAAHDTRVDAFTGGYSSVRALPDPSSLRVHVAIGLTERAFRAVTRIRARALLGVPAILDEAKALLRGSE